MTKTTAPPRANVLEAVPELTRQATTTIRLHPRRGDVPELSASKIGGRFLWPDVEPWPTQTSHHLTHRIVNFEIGGRRWDFPDGTPFALLPILQINAKDVPAFSFPSGKDLLQILWVPLHVDESPYHWVIRAFWRNSLSVQSPLTDMPSSPFADPIPFPGAVPKPCTLTFENVVEYPSTFELSHDIAQRILAWQETLTDIVFEDASYQGTSSLYDFELSVCPSTKLGGYVHWLQEPQQATCTCGHTMAHLLTLSDCEVDSGTWPRWLPLEDREGWHGAYSGDDRVDAPDWWLGGGNLYCFVCQFCSDWPVKVIYQR